MRLITHTNLRRWDTHTQYNKGEPRLAPGLL